MESESLSTEDALTFDEIQLDFMLVADGAQAVDGKLYVLGGGWTHLWMPEIPGRPPIPFAVALGMIVPWNKTNTRFGFSLELLDADGERVGGAPVAWGEIEQGRPPGLTPGTDQRIVLATPVSVEFPAEGRYVFAASVNGREVGRTGINVQRVPQPMQPPQPAA